MERLLLFAILVSIALSASAIPPRSRIPKPEPQNIKNSVQTSKIIRSEADIQNENANYAFSYSVDDGINGLTQEREETRKGKSITGHYSFNDGFFYRSIYYVADEGGFRIVKSEEKPIDRNGPVYNPEGYARVQLRGAGRNVDYTIQNLPSENGRNLYVDVTQNEKGSALDEELSEFTSENEDQY